jgi:plasmid segregation protein ParM
MNIGVDSGFYATKAITAGKDPFKFLSVMGKPVDSMVNMNGHVNLVVTSPFGTHQVGREAVRFNPGDTRQEFSDWVQTPEYMQILYAALGGLTEATQFNVNLGCGLPIADFARYREVLQTRLLGRHEFTIEAGDRRAQVAKIETVRVLPQGWGAVLCLFLDDNGNIADPGLSKQRVAVLDIGGRTVGYLSVDGLADVPDQSRSTRRGAWNVVRSLREFYTLHYPDLAENPDHVLMEAVLAREDFNEGKPIDLHPVVDPIVEDIGEEIVRTSRQYWGNTAATFRKVLVIGGGAYIWGDIIKKAFPHTVVLPDPEFANARGYFRYVVAKAKRG